MEEARRAKNRARNRAKRPRTTYEDGAELSRTFREYAFLKIADNKSEKMKKAQD